jgi:SPP1 gp7 family putative phage head morphogenesis protein
LEHILKNGGLAIKFKLTPAVNDVVQATTKANVALVTNLAQKHLSDIEGLVMRSVQKGGDVGGLAKDLEERYKMTRKRARLVARDQNSKATAAIVRTRQAELGITQAKWLHSHAGKKPRPSHVAMNGKLYDVKEGMWDPDADGKGKGRNVFPGELINCRCASRSVIPALGVR